MFVYCYTLKTYRWVSSMWMPLLVFSTPTSLFSWRPPRGCTTFVQRTLRAPSSGWTRSRAASQTPEAHFPERTRGWVPLPSPSMQGDSLCISRTIAKPPVPVEEERVVRAPQRSALRQQNHCHRSPLWNCPYSDLDGPVLPIRQFPLNYSWAWRQESSTDFFTFSGEKAIALAVKNSGFKITLSTSRMNKRIYFW